MSSAARRTSTRATASIDFSGPFFRKDVEKTIFENLHKFMEGIAQEGSAAARQGLRTGSSSRALIRELGDRVADHVVGRTVSLTGRRWTAAAVVQVLNEGYSGRQSMSLMAAASIVERRTGAIRRVTRGINANKADLTKGLE
jgi:hypothetical protein